VLTKSDKLEATEHLQFLNIFIKNKMSNKPFNLIEIGKLSKFYNL